VADSELRRLGCDQAQGYFMCRPVPAAEVEHWLANGATVEESGTPLGRSPLAVLASEELD
jgi:predicted signal transduction protein with EAL and GGDEF domain